MAAANNAEWCDVVCRTHDLDPRFDADAWTSPTRTPPFYPDAVTLVPDVSVPDLLARIDTSPGCSIKDSFASLDLTPCGFRALIDAEWIVRSSTAAHRTTATGAWTVVRDADTFSAWERAWRGDDGPRDVLLPDLLRTPSVVVLAGRVGDHVVAGAVLHRSSEVVGISNVFTGTEVASTSWEGCLALAETIFPGAILVGWETGDALAAARSHGFASAGPLRVWLRQD